MIFKSVYFEILLLIKLIKKLKTIIIKKMKKRNILNKSINIKEFPNFPEFPTSHGHFNLCPFFVLFFNKKSPFLVGFWSFNITLSVLLLPRYEHLQGQLLH